MKISIAMATYNGAKYLQEQLDSFITQTLQPDELVVCDDGSTDETIATLNRFAETAPFQVRIFVNPENLGYTQNFGKVIGLCTGDIIFLSDQDDVWLPKKLHRVAQIFLNNSQVKLVINDQIITDENLQHSGVTKLGNISHVGLPQSRFITGCCSAMHRDMLRIVLPIPELVKPHDVWIHQFGLRLNCRTVLVEPLQFYRRHGENTSSWFASSSKKIHWSSLMKLRLINRNTNKREEQFLIIFDHLKLIQQRLTKLKEEDCCYEPEKSIYIQAIDRVDLEIDAYQFRIKLYSYPYLFRLPLIIRYLLSGGYQYFSGLSSALMDLIDLPEII
jgi:glycosyltransferase involved in cell wall biosynthesis